MTHTASTTPELRAATAADLPSINRLLQSSHLPTIDASDTRSSFIVAESGGDLVGVVGLESCGDRIELLRSTAVADTWRGRGVGRQLVERAIGGAASRGIASLYLLTTTAEDYFPTFGFSKVERTDLPEEVKATDEFRSACPATATVMTLRLA